MDTMTSYEITFQTPNYTLHTQGVGADEDEAVADAIKNLKDEDGIDVSKAWVLEVEQEQHHPHRQGELGGDTPKVIT